jgi:hypothetical protein
MHFFDGSGEWRTAVAKLLRMARPCAAASVAVLSALSVIGFFAQ